MELNARVKKDIATRKTKVSEIMAVLSIDMPICFASSELTQRLRHGIVSQIMVQRFVRSEVVNKYGEDVFYYAKEFNLEPRRAVGSISKPVYAESIMIGMCVWLAASVQHCLISVVSLFSGIYRFGQQQHDNDCSRSSSWRTWPCHLVNCFRY